MNFLPPSSQCCGDCPEPDLCSDGADYSEHTWDLDDNITTGQNVRYSASVIGQYSISSSWSEDATKGQSAPSVKFNSTVSISATGVNGSVTVVDYLLFDDAIYDPQELGHLSFSVCVNGYGKMNFTGQDGTKTNLGLQMCLIAKQGSNLYLWKLSNSPGHYPLDRRCWDKESVTVGYATFWELLSGEGNDDTSSVTLKPFPPGDPVQLGLGVLTTCIVNTTSDSVYKSVTTSGWFDNFALTVNDIGWSCYPGCGAGTGSNDLALTVSGSSTSFSGGSCSVSHADTDGTFVCGQETGGGGYCKYHYPGGTSLPYYDVESWWTCTDGTGTIEVARYVIVDGTYTGPFNSGHSITAKFYFVRLTSGAGVYLVMFKYETTDLWDCENPVTLTLTDTEVSYIAGGTTSLGAVTSYNLADGVGPTMSIVMPSTVELEPA